MGRGYAAPKGLCPGKPRGSPTLKAAGGVTATWARRRLPRRGGRPRHARRGRPSNLGGPCLSTATAGLAEAPFPNASGAPGVCGRTPGRSRTSVRSVVGRRRGETRAPANTAGESEGCIRASKPGNGVAPRSWPSKGSPCGLRTSGGKHEPSLDLDQHVPATSEGSGTSQN